MSPKYSPRRCRIPSKLTGFYEVLFAYAVKFRLERLALNLSRTLTATPRLQIREGYPPVRQKKHGQEPECAKAILDEVQKLVKAGIMREVLYHDWLSNPL
ncbi:hypothetical protein Tco_1032776 [Tanacetum coccineum]|uniref:Reverse transcriptase domain-containing protein n=1 Tax=Tanacetum coccineum TaxID=301880 RepID=A0ABQ5GCS1_9ASTR